MTSIGSSHLVVNRWALVLTLIGTMVINGEWVVFVVIVCAFDLIFIALMLGCGFVMLISAASS